MKAGDLIKDRHGNYGVIIAQMSKPNHVSVLWADGYETAIHTQHLYKPCWYK